MSTLSPKDRYKFEISLSVLNHLGRNLYRSFVTVLGEAISNSWDADAKNVWIFIDKEKKGLVIVDDGDGMTTDDFQEKFLRIGYSKRRNGMFKSSKGRPFIGAKGIGKLALLSCADKVAVYTKTKETNYTGGMIDNAKLDNAITENMQPDTYLLDVIDLKMIEDIRVEHKNGTILLFQGTRELIRNREDYIRGLLAHYFRFSIIDKEFNIYVNGKLVSVDDLKKLSGKTEFIWKINEYQDEYTEQLHSLKNTSNKTTSRLPITGFIATVDKPKDLAIPGTGERASVDLFVNGRLREKNILRSIPTHRIVENYIYGQVHYNSMDKGENDPFTTSREGVMEGNEEFEQLKEYLRRELLSKIIEEWDDLRRLHRKPGDLEDKRVPKVERLAMDMVREKRKAYTLPDKSPNKQEVENWLNELHEQARFGLSAYTDCFVAENLLRKYLRTNNTKIGNEEKKRAEVNINRESARRTRLNVMYEVVAERDHLSYLGFGDLTNCVKIDNKKIGERLSKLTDSYFLVRNVVGHTGMVTGIAKKHLSIVLANVEKCIQKLLK